MSARTSPTPKNVDNKKLNSLSIKEEKKYNSKEDVRNQYQEEIDRLVREREEIRSKLNTICSKIIENINIDDYQDDVDLTKQQPSDISLDNLLSMIDDICYYRTGVLNHFHEIEDNEKIAVQKKITQLSIEDPNLFRKRLTLDQRLTFVARERDVWKENAQLLQIMYATIVDQLEIGMLKNRNSKATHILQSHRLNIEDVYHSFSSPVIRSIKDTKKNRIKQATVDKENHVLNEQNVVSNSEQQHNDNNSSNISITNSNETEVQQNNSSLNKKRTVVFNNEINVVYVDREADDQNVKVQDQSQERIFSTKSSLPLASDTLVDKMDSNLRMLIIKELSKDNHIQRKPSKTTLNSLTSITDLKSLQQQHRSRNGSYEWVKLARLIDIDESEIDHWLSQSLQYPAGRVISTWCNCSASPPTVAELHSLLTKNELNRLDLAHHIETMYSI